MNDTKNKVILFEQGINILNRNMDLQDGHWAEINNHNPMKKIQRNLLKDGLRCRIIYAAKWIPLVFKEF